MQTRNPNGTYSRSHKFTLWLIIIVLGVLTMLGSMKYQEHQNKLTVELPKIAAIAHADTTLEAKVDELKNEIIDDLAKKCETKDVKEPDAAIILDANNEMSIGSWMFQIITVQHYVLKFENREISRVEAIQIAIDHDKAKALATKIAFEEEPWFDAKRQMWKGGIYNWHNCAIKYDLPTKVDLIKRLTS